MSGRLCDESSFILIKFWGIDFNKLVFCYSIFLYFSNLSWQMMKQLFIILFKCIIVSRRYWCDKRKHSHWTICMCLSDVTVWKMDAYVIWYFPYNCRKPDNDKFMNVSREILFYKELLTHRFNLILRNFGWKTSSLHPKSNIEHRKFCRIRKNLWVKICS